MTDQELLDFADKAKEKAYAPYSRFQVGGSNSYQRRKSIHRV